MRLNINHQLNIIHGMHTTCSNGAHLLHVYMYIHLIILKLKKVHVAGIVNANLSLT